VQIAYSGQVRFAFTTRQGGASAAPYESLNLGDHVGDEPDTVRTNRRTAAESLGVDTTGSLMPGSLALSDYEAQIANRGTVEDLSAYFSTGNAPSVAAGRLAYFFDWHGPALTVDTAGVRESSVWPYDFAHEFDGGVGMENRDLWLPTYSSTRFEIGGTWGGAATLSVLTNDVTIAGNVWM